MSFVPLRAIAASMASKTNLAILIDNALLGHLGWDAVHVDSSRAWDWRDA